MSTKYSQSAMLRGSTPNNCSAVYQKELAVPHQNCYSYQRSGKYFVWGAFAGVLDILSFQKSAL